MKLATALASALVFSAGASQAMTVLTFDGNVCSQFSDGSGALTSCSSGSRINQSYGDVAGVDVSWRESPASSASAAFWPDSYSGMSRVAYGDRPLITLAGAVTLHSFDIGAWPNINRQSQVTVVDLATSTTVLSTGPITILGSTPTNFSLDLYSPAGFTIQFGPDGFNVGIDNIAFTAGVVPEPGTWALLAAGLAAVGGVARRRHKA
jgi:hypothetical protein